jgi:hypothetical protein
MGGKLNRELLGVKGEAYSLQASRVKELADVWGDSTNRAFSILWGDSMLWGDGTLTSDTSNISITGEP